MKSISQVIDGVEYHAIQTRNMNEAAKACRSCVGTHNGNTTKLCVKLNQGHTNNCWATKDVTTAHDGTERIFWQTKEGYALWRLTA